MQIRSWESARKKMVPMAMVLLHSGRPCFFSSDFLGICICCRMVDGWGWCSCRCSNSDGTTGLGWRAIKLLLLLLLLLLHTQFLKFTPSLVVVRPFYFSEGSSKGQLLIYCLDPTKVHLWNGKEANMCLLRKQVLALPNQTKPKILWIKPNQIRQNQYFPFRLSIANLCTPTTIWWWF